MSLIEHRVAGRGMDLKAELDKPVSSFMVRQLITISDGDTVVRAAKVMSQEKVGALVVVSSGKKVGIITERDILNKVVAAEKDASKTKVSSVMSSPIRTVEQDVSAGDAIALMVKLGIRRLGVTKEGEVVGLVSQRSIVSIGSGGQVVLPELELPSGLRCPYCLEEMSDGKELSRHIDLIHIGKGLLEGDLRKA